MHVLVHKNTPDAIKNALANLNLEQDVLAFGNVWVKTDDGVLIAVFVMNDKEFSYNFQSLQAQIVEAQALTKYIYVCIIDPQNNVKPHQLLAVQEMGAYTLTIDSINRLEKFIVFVADPKRRTDKKFLPSRNTSLYTLGEQLLFILPGIGAKKVAKLLEYFGTPAWAFVGLTQFSTVDDVIGITEEDIQKYRDILELEPNQILLIDTTDLSQPTPVQQETMFKVVESKPERIVTDVQKTKVSFD